MLSVIPAFAGMTSQKKKTSVGKAYRGQNQHNIL